MTSPIVFLLVRQAGMYMFNMDRLYNQPIVASIVSPIVPPNHIKHVQSNGQPIKDMIGVVVNRLVGMGFKTE